MIARIRFVTFILFTCIAAGMVAHGATQESKEQNSSAVAAARQVIQELAAGQFDKIEAQYDARMATALPAGKLARAGGA